MSLNTDYDQRDHDRRLLARSSSQSQRRRVLCRWCRSKIPEARRVVALYCSVRCKDFDKAYARQALQCEIRQALRTERASAACEDCSEPLALGSRGPVPRTCRRCTARRYRERQQDEEK